MSLTPSLVPTAEAAFIAGLNDRQMHRVMDEHLVPSALLGQDGSTRLFARLGAAFARFYYDTEGVLVASARRQVLEELTLRVTHLPDPAEVMALHSLPRDVSWRVFRTGVDIDVGPFVAQAFVRAREVDDADALVSVDPEVMGGAPCFTGTRVPIDTVLASLDRGVGKAELRESFQFLTDTHLSAARVYAAVHPRRGRPRPLGEMNPLMKPVSSRVVRPAQA
jgi:uncharacterized protein (DUF433 family)